MRRVVLLVGLLIAAAPILAVGLYQAVLLWAFDWNIEYFLSRSRTWKLIAFEAFMIAVFVGGVVLAVRYRKPRPPAVDPQTHDAS